MVAVRMVSEGVDVPRLAVGVYATTDLDAALLRPGRRAFRAGPAARRDRLRLPADRARPARLANEMEVERDHVLDKAEEAERGGPVRRVREGDEARAGARHRRGQFEALESDAVFDRVLYDGAEFGMQAHPGSEEEQDYLGIPGSWSPTRCRMLLRRHQAQHQARHSGTAQVSAHAELRALRKELNALVAAWHHRTDQPHGVIHAELRSACGGPSSAIATADELRQRIDHIRDWAISGRRR